MATGKWRQTSIASLGHSSPESPPRHACDGKPWHAHPQVPRPRKPSRGGNSCTCPSRRTALGSPAAPRLDTTRTSPGRVPACRGRLRRVPAWSGNCHKISGTTVRHQDSTSNRPTPQPTSSSRKKCEQRRGAPASASCLRHPHTATAPASSGKAATAAPPDSASHAFAPDPRHRLHNPRQPPHLSNPVQPAAPTSPEPARPVLPADAVP
mmetsp:Transcript_151831/g.487228  ORF Transcript_151831/g.487228 Transcript_151831/m.487228 type:complete len:209 (-) Transcript_151831:61-687(-)